MERYPTVWRKIEKQSNPKWWIYYKGNVSVLVNLHQDFKMMKQVLIEQRSMFDKIQKQSEENIYKDHVTIQSFNQSSFSKFYHVIDTGNDFKQKETIFFSFLLL